MQRTSTWKFALGSLLVAGVVVGAWACNEDPEEPAVATAVTQAPAAEKTTERLLARSEERWTHIAKGDWIVGYDYMSPTIKQWMTIYQFLEGKGNHKYEDPAKPEFVGFDPEDENRAYVQVNVKWTPLHSMIDLVKDKPEDLSQRIEMVETWDWAEGDWGMHWPPERVSDFYASHPELLKSK